MNLGQTILPRKNGQLFLQNQHTVNVISLHLSSEVVLNTAFQTIAEHRFLCCDLVEAGRWTSLGLTFGIVWLLTTEGRLTDYLQGLDVVACCFEFISPLTTVMKFNKRVRMLQKIHSFYHMSSELLVCSPVSIFIQIMRRKTTWFCWRFYSREIF